MTVKYLILVWYRFLSSKLRIARLSMGFRLNHFNVESDSSSFRRYKFSTSSFLITSRLSWKLFCPLESLGDDTAHAPYGALRHGERKHIFRNKKMFPFELARFVFFFFQPPRTQSRNTKEQRWKRRKQKVSLSIHFIYSSSKPILDYSKQSSTAVSRFLGNASYIVKIKGT